MQEYNIHIEIDEDGNIKADAKGFKDNSCEYELDEILQNIDGVRDIKNKPEYHNTNKSVISQGIKTTNKIGDKN